MCVYQFYSLHSAEDLSTFIEGLLCSGWGDSPRSPFPLLWLMSMLSSWESVPQWLLKMRLYPLCQSCILLVTNRLYLLYTYMKAHPINPRLWFSRVAIVIVLAKTVPVGPQLEVSEFYSLPSYILRWRNYQ